MNSLTRMPSSVPAVGTQQGGWFWDGSNWVCDPDCSVPQPSPPFGPPVFSGPTQQPPWYPGANGGVSFGAVAPPNPVRGHFWWDGKTFWMFDGAAWVAVGGTIEPQLGVTDGSNALPGDVGEWINYTQNFNYTVASQTQSLTLGVLPPGDWNCNASAQAFSAVTALQVFLQPQPAGFSNPMWAYTITGTAQPEWVVVTTPVARASITAATAVQFSIITNNAGAGPQAGNGTMTFSARRAR
jgi:hypothetical protein